MATRPAQPTADTARARTGGPLLWLHAPPPEECAAAAELIRQLTDERPDLSVLLTQEDEGPSWSAGFTDLPPPHHAPAPREGTRAATAFVDQWRPDLAVFYPATLPTVAATQAHSQGTALFLITRDLPESWRHRWRIGTGLTRRMLRRFDRLFAQTRDSAGQLRAMGLPRWQITPCGPLSEGSAVLGCSDAERDALAMLIAGRPTWLAACTQRAEDPVAVAAHSAVIRQAHRLLLILVPDEPARGPDLAQRLRTEGWDVALRSDEEEPEAETQIYIADTEGEMGLWLRLAPVSFLGGTLGANAGPDPYAAAALGSAILHGPATGAHARHYLRLGAANATRTVRDEQTMAAALAELLAPDRAATMARAAWEVSTEGTAATERVTRRMLEALDLAKAG
ncbi:MAG: 3-deoxy-D-manno-octulosonic acid transferase [Rhodobacteraceae bacterium]|nr:3-deoxy-D-manno-octulosonic acid transferase [Paracoccaceae bacterium]